MRQLILFFAFFLFSISTITGQSDYQSHLALAKEADYFESQKYMTGKPIFDFSAETIDGEKVALEDLKGKVLVINLWFMSCPPCIAEMPGLNQIVSKYETDNRIEFISFTLDAAEDLAKDFFPNHDFEFQIVADAENFIMEDIAHRWGFPTTFVVDKYGKIRKIISGGSTDEMIATKQIQESLLPIIDECLNK